MPWWSSQSIKFNFSIAGLRPGQKHYFKEPHYMFHSKKKRQISLQKTLANRFSLEDTWFNHALCVIWLKLFLFWFGSVIRHKYKLKELYWDYVIIAVLLRSQSKINQLKNYCNHFNISITQQSSYNMIGNYWYLSTESGVFSTICWLHQTFLVSCAIYLEM